jgi:hypothetical protein
MSFRDAYKEVGLHLGDVDSADPRESVNSRMYTGTSGNLRLDQLYLDQDLLKDRIGMKKDVLQDAMTGMFGKDFADYTFFGR